MFIDGNVTISLKGITDGVAYSLGVIYIRLHLENWTIDHEFHVVDNNFPILSHGIIGRDFFKINKCTIDYASMEFTSYIPEPVTIPIIFDVFQDTVSIPPRSECHREFFIATVNDTYFVDSQELIPGVFCGRTIVETDRHILKIINTTNKPVEISKSQICYENINNYDIFNIDKVDLRSDRLNELIKLASANIPSHCKDELLDLIIEFQDIFALQGDRMTVNNFYQQTLRTSSSNPTFIKNYRLPFSQKLEIERQVDNLITNNLIEPSCSSYNSPLLLVPKKSIGDKKKWRLCVDYRSVNKQLISDSHPLPIIEDILNNLGRAKYFSVLDLFSGFHQVPLEKDSRDITSFTANNATYQWKVLPFGLKVSPNSFSRMMSLAFAGATEAQHFIYIDDIIVVGRSTEHHIANLRAIFEKCRTRNLKLNPEKCDFFKTEVTYLGHLCSEKGILPDSAKLRAMELYPVPSDKDAVKRFVAFANYYRKFIRNFASLSRSLNNLTRKSTEFVWQNEHQTAFQKIKKALMAPPILSYPNFEKEFTLFVDASQFAVGAVLTQLNDCNEYLPIAFASKCFNKAENNKSTIEKELMAIHFAIKYFKHFLYGVHFIVKSDHKPLSYLFALKDPTSRLTRLRLELEEFNFSIEYIKGKDNVLADALSRISIQDIKNTANTDKIILAMTTRSMSRKNTNNPKINLEISNNNIYDLPMVFEPINQNNLRNNPILSFRVLPNGNRLEWTIQFKRKQNAKIAFSFNAEEITRSILATLNEFVESLLSDNAFLYHRDPRDPVVCKLYNDDPLFSYVTIGEFKQVAQQILTKIRIALVTRPVLITDKSEQTRILHHYHNHPIFGAHCGRRRLYAKLKSKFKWYNLAKDVRNYVNKCEDCQRNKVNFNIKEPMCITSSPSKPFDTLIIDTVGPLPMTSQGNKYIVTAMCDLTKYLISIPIPNKEASSVARALVENVFLQYGNFKSIRTDQGTEYKNSLLKEILSLLGVEHMIGTAYHHESVGTVERNHRVLNEYLRSYLGKHNEWDELIKFFTYSYNCTPHTSFEFRYSPFELVYGKSPEALKILQENKVEPMYNFDTYSSLLKNNLQLAHRDAQQLLNNAKAKSKVIYDRNCNTIDVKVGDLILVKNESKGKFDPEYAGPFEVIELSNFNVSFNHKNKINTVHRNRIKKFNN